MDLLAGSGTARFGLPFGLAATLFPAYGEGASGYLFTQLFQMRQGILDAFSREQDREFLPAIAEGLPAASHFLNN
ncbi:hypothetical protein D3C73_1357990 [compost metagenome]